MSRFIVIRRESGLRRYGVEDTHRPSRPLVTYCWTVEGARRWVKKHTWREV